MRTNLNVPDELLAQVDDAAKAMYMTRTAWLIMAMQQRLQTDTVAKSLPMITEMYNDAKLRQIQEALSTFETSGDEL